MTVYARPAGTKTASPQPFHDWNETMTQTLTTPPAAGQSTTMRAAVVTEFGAPLKFENSSCPPRVRRSAGEVGDLRRMPHRSACRTW